MPRALQTTLFLLAAITLTAGLHAQQSPTTPPTTPSTPQPPASADNTAANTANAQAAANQTPIDQMSDQQLSTKLHEILVVHCALCHGPDAEAPAAGLNFLTDINRIRNITAFIVPHKPDDSPMYTIVARDEMPPHESGIAPLNAKEKQLFKQWILAGAPELHNVPTHAQAAAKHNYLGQPPAKHPPISAFRKFAETVGQFHPPSTHFPIALILAAALAELLYIITRKQNLLPTVRFLIWLAGLSAVVTMTLGLLDAAYMSFTPRRQGILNIHRILGIATAVLSVLLVLVLELRTVKQPNHPRMLLRVLLFTTAILVAFTGFFGGALVYGLGYYRF